MEGPGQYLGYRAMQRKVREQHKLAVPRNLEGNRLNRNGSGK